MCWSYLLVLYETINSSRNYADLYIRLQERVGLERVDIVTCRLDMFLQLLLFFLCFVFHKPWCTLQVVGGMSWHQNQPYLAVGSDRKVLLWKIDNV